MAKRSLVAVVCGVVIVGSLFALFGPSMDKTKDVRVIQYGLHHILGASAAEEAAKLIGRTGTVVVVTMDLAQDPQGNAGNELEGFLTATNSVGRLVVVATVVAKPELAETKRAAVLSGEQFLQIVKQYRDVHVIVSLAGPPDLTEAQIQQLPEKMPRVVAGLGLTYRAQLKPLFKDDIIQVAIVPRIGKPPSGERPQTASEWYDYSYVVVTAANAASLPE